METQVITEAEIKEQQLLIAQWMQVPEEIIGILNQDLPWRIPVSYTHLRAHET